MTWTPEAPCQSERDQYQTLTETERPGMAGTFRCQGGNGVRIPLGIYGECLALG